MPTDATNKEVRTCRFCGEENGELLHKNSDYCWDHCECRDRCAEQLSKLKWSVGIAHAAHHTALERNLELLSEIAALREIVKCVEWSNRGFCPMCDGSGGSGQGTGHKDNCALAALLSTPKQTGEGE